MILNVLCSFLQTIKYILLGKKLDVLLYYPQHFNRSSKGSNPYFDPIVEVPHINLGQRGILRFLIR